MSEKSKSDRTSVTISKGVHQDFKVACAKAGLTQKGVLERLIRTWVKATEMGERLARKKED